MCRFLIFCKNSIPRSWRLFGYYVDLYDHYVDLSDNDADLSDNYVDLSDIKLIEVICHHSFVINRENIKLRARTARDLNISRLKVSDIFIDLRNLYCFVFLYYVSEFLWEQIHIKHLINYQNRIFILISHYSTIVFESKQCTIVLKMGMITIYLVERQIDWQELRGKTRWSIGKHPLIIISKSPRSEGFPFLQSS